MTSQGITLPDGRTMGYEAYGAHEGPLVFALHGTPTCSLAFENIDKPASTLGIREVAPDRPGIRSSSARPGYRVIDVAQDLVAAADALGMERFGVLGWSGGGPYALATADVATDRLLGVVVAAGMGPLDSPHGASGYSSFDQQMLRWSRDRPWLARVSLGTMGFACRVAPGLIRSALSGDLSPRDKEVAEVATRDQSSRMAMRFVSEAFRGGAGGVVADYAALGSPWGFALEDIKVRVHVWQGDDDRMVSPVHARAIVERAPTCELIECPGEGHMIAYTHAEEMLRQAATLD